MKYQYYFSIIIAVYNTGNYLKESIDSVINQTLDFEENVQLILVDDCSSDNSRSIIEEYKNRYPDNIEAIFLDENSGQWTARNTALDNVKGKYVNFLDSDDYISLDTLEEVLSFFEDNYDKTDIVSIPIQFFERMTSPHILNKKFGEDRVIDLTLEPNNPQLSASSAFFKEELFKRYKFPTNMSFSEDAFLISKILFEKKTLGVISKPTYYYRRRADASSTIDNSINGEDYFISRLENYFIELINYSIEKEGNVIDYLKYVIAYELQWTLQLEKITLDDKKKEDKFWELLYYIIDYIDIENITKNRYINNDLCKLFFISLKNRDVHIESEENNVLLKSDDYTLDNLSNHKLWIDIVEIKNNTLKISGFLNSLFNKNQISVFAEKTDDKNNKSVYFGKYVRYTSRKDVYFLSKHWQTKFNFDIAVPIDKDGLQNIKLVVAYHLDESTDNTDMDNLIILDLKVDFSNYANISNTSKYFVHEDHILLFQTNMFKTYPYKYKSLIRRELSVLKTIISKRQSGYMEAFCLRLLYLIAYPFVQMMKKNKKIYIFMDRPESGDDNANALFKYASGINDNNVKYFVLMKDVKKFNETSKIGKMLKYKSFKHKIIYLFADKLISSHPYQTVINPFYEGSKGTHKLYSGLITLDIYFVQHGVTLGNISGWLSKFDKNLSLISTVSDKEHDSFLVEGYNYDESIVQTLGFPRFDYLNDNNQRQILIIPSWRKYLRGNKEIFLKSSYYKNLTNILNNEKIHKLAEENGYTIKFKAHPELIRYIDNQNKEKYVDLIDVPEHVCLSTDESYQKLFKESSLMITDYSSVFFDFGYLKKPIIYYQPESTYHYESSYFDIQRDGFGDLISSEEELVEKIKYFLNNDCINEQKYNERIEEFFKYNDNNNCKRVYEWINNH